MAEWSEAGGGPAQPSEAGTALDARFRAAVAEDLDLPRALVVMGELLSAADVTPSEKAALLGSWDAVLGLDLARTAGAAQEIPPEVRDLIGRRDRARADGDYAASDLIRADLVAAGWEVMDTADGTQVRRRS